MLFPTSSCVFLALASVITPSLASIYVTKPVADTIGTGNKSLTITWLADSGDYADATPLASNFGKTTISLMTGSTTVQTVLQELGTVNDPSETLKLSAVIDPSVGPTSKLYFLRFQSNSNTTSGGVPLQAFSARFELTKMTGTFTAAESSANVNAFDVSTTTSKAASSSTKATSTTSKAVTTGSTKTGGMTTSSASTTGTVAAKVVDSGVARETSL
ncbi:hypothetical protein MNV49_001364, partial [Pseudohyphozyma bogoriensis]